jgi:hypothetical protein
MTISNLLYSHHTSGILLASPLPPWFLFYREEKSKILEVGAFKISPSSSLPSLPAQLIF